jgi:exonuclease-1
MGIQGLLPLLKSIQQPICVSELAGSTIGVDVYCWLHKGAYGCALALAEGNDSDLYVCFASRLL